LCRDIVKLCEINDKVRVADVNCGTGRFFNWLPSEKNILGIEQDGRSQDIAKHAFNKGCIYNMNFFNYLSGFRGVVNYMVGNPPFNLVERGLYDHPLATDNDQEDG
jgi:predicted RNA methylase